MGLIKTDGIAPNGATGLLLYTDGQATVVGLKLESGGGVGFGSAAVPSGLKVDVLGNIATAVLSIPASSSIATINTISTMRIGQANSSIKLNIGCNASSSWIQSYNVSNSGAAPLLLQSGGGNVGIGTTNPSAKLAIVAAGTAEALHLTVGTTGDIGLRVYEDLDSAGYLRLRPISDAQKGFIFSDFGDAPILNVNTLLYRVGIGTLTPTVALDVVGEARSSIGTTAGSNAKTLATKDYVDTSRAFGGYVTGLTLNHTAPAGTITTTPIQTTTDIILMIIRPENNVSGNKLEVFADIFTPPTTLRQMSESDKSTSANIILPIPKGYYWKVTSTGTNSGSTTITWMPVGS